MQQRLKSPVEGVLMLLRSMRGSIPRGGPLRATLEQVVQMVEEWSMQLVEMEAAVHATERDAERKAFGVINHTSKRVMSNTAQSCELIIKTLKEHQETLGTDGAQAIQLLNATRKQSVNGFHTCRSVLLQASVIRGEHKPGRDEFTMSSLFEDLGLMGLPRIQFGGVCPEAIRADKQVLTSILFNATQNALSHGEAEGIVAVNAQLAQDVLHVSVHSRPGGNHDKLLAAVQARDQSGHGLDSAAAGNSHDLLCAEAHTLQAMGVGEEQSTYQGLHEIRVFCAAFRPPADAHLLVQPDGVLFELRLPVAVVAPLTIEIDGGDVDAPHASPSLPKGLAFVCCDDDDMPRIFAQLLLTRAEADENESHILGETAEEVSGLVDLLLEMAERLGDERVLCICDQNLDSFETAAFTGMGLVRELRQRGFKGLFVIQSANDELEDEQAYLAAGADGSFGKAVRGGIPEMLDVLGRLHHARFGATATATVSRSPTRRERRRSKG